jgi:hypothetical protein
LSDYEYVDRFFIAVLQLTSLEIQYGYRAVSWEENPEESRMVALVSRQLLQSANVI